ncbi:L-fucose/L-arabinose isomerase family protein [Phytoactinopolyspora mesophila]|uniref:FucIase n=1 Tax=Phytoactinopolyspora mesophila TaxID=2650750 RepID=A0A7K3MCN1_9ACTN|nr:fucose isomerase [Phytoactinopolyspora mesophila]
MARIGIISFSDGRDFVQEETNTFVAKAEERLADRLRAAGHDVVLAAEPITSNELAVREARRIADARVDLTLFHYAVWAFPHFSALAAAETTGAILLLSNIDPQYPGMVGMLAAGGSLDQVGRTHSRAWGDIGDDALVRRVSEQARAGHAVAQLRGSTFGRIGGRSMGMYTAVGNPDTWIAKFGIDVEEIDQWEIVRRTELQDAARLKAGREWIERHAASVEYDGKQLTPEILERQIGSYLAMRELIDEWNLDFTGIKGQPELTTHFATMDIAEALLNDPYDWDGPKEPHVCATEVDMDGALTMQILKRLSGTPVLFADVRHYWADRNVWDLANSGQHATWYAARSDDPADNLGLTRFMPESFYFPAGGASVRHFAAPGRMTFARLSRLDGRYRMQVTLGDVERYDDATNEQLAAASSPEWPHAFARFDAPAEAFLSVFGANHIHAVPGDWTAELRSVCRLLDVDYVDLALVVA